MTRQPTVLVVEDEPQMRMVLSFALETQGFAVLVAHGGATALTLLRTRKIDLVLLDLVMPVMDGLTLCRLIREQSEIPVMMVTCLSQPEEVITGLEHGADDYVSKPFHPREVALRAQALIRRSAGNPGQHVVHVHRLRIDPARHLAHVAGQRIELGFTDFKLLAYLAAHRGTPQGWRVLLGEVWGAKDTAGGAGMVKAAVYRLRSRLAEADSDTDYILTLRGAGYLMPDLPPSGD